ncbi:hypothetical protein A0J61_10633 [Choanephora cucurbitarum]|uniref:Uncharacterized protein n=1 Tax=Choanephora cucurbitarum TaxID=101091 RepID=A0A1C7MX43_9FUNG|nr:hypothetical protein A0J61_10633 [Choanephora cucurbitarum]
MNFIGEQELHDFLRSQKDYKLELFLQQHEELISATNSYNNWKKLKATWTKRYKDAIMQVKPNMKHVSKTLTSVEDSYWQALFRRVKTGQNDQLQLQLLDWCTQLLDKRPVTVNIQLIKSEIVRLEQQNDKTLVNRLNLMSFKLLNSFETLSLTEKCVLNLTVLSIIDLSKKVYSDQYQKYLPLSVFESLSSLEPPTVAIDDSQIDTYFEEFKKIIFECSESMVPIAVAKRGLRDQICYIMIYLHNKIAEWEEDENEEDEDEDDDDDDDDVDEEEEQIGGERKRKRIEAPSENDMMMVVKFILDAVFADTGLKWRSGEKTDNATKRSRIIHETASSSNASINNIMERRFGLTLRNRRGIDLCLVDFKNGSSPSDEITQDSKSLRRTKSLYAYNSSLTDKRMWSMNWNGYKSDICYMTKYEGVDVVLAAERLFIPSKTSEVGKLKDFFIALYRFKKQILDYEQSLSVAFTASE